MAEGVRPLGSSLTLSCHPFAARDDHVLNLVTRAGIPTVVLYGGGYNRDREHTARLHAATVLRAAACQNNGV
jgi:acetoin utilization deacetylase AcuC-like enzyme